MSDNNIHTPKKVLITDVDNTLFDWVDVWYKSFNAMLTEIVNISGLKREDLIEEIKKIHQEHGTSEYAFLIESIPSLKKLHPNTPLLEVYGEAIHAFRSARKKSLVLYDGVLSTLEHLKENNIRVIAFTESMSFYTRYRFIKLGLDGLIDTLYSPADHELPKDRCSNNLTSYEMSKTKQVFLARNLKKPAPETLMNILESENLSIDECVYIGDSLMKDVAMAQAAGVLDIYAHYGKANTREEYELLKAVTHWSDEDVKREANLSKQTANPTIELNHSFAELLQKIDFK